MVAIKSGDEDLNSHMCQSWPTAGQPSLQQFDVLTQVSGPFLDECASSDEVLRMYLDPSNLPRGTHIARQTKKSRVDVARYRLRSPQDHMSCRMTNYSVGYELPNHTVQQGGLYGALLALPSGLRFCSTPEMYLLQLRQIVEIFARLFESRVKASTLSIHEVEGGFMLSLSDIAATIPMHLCEDLVMRSPVDEIKIHVQVGPKIAEVLRVLMGASTPDDISLVPGGILDHKVPLHPDVLMRLEKTTLFASVQACPLMPTMMFERSEGMLDLSLPCVPLVLLPL